MDEFETNLQSASDRLTRLVEGPGLEAATMLEQAFGRAGANIEQILSRAARSGEVDFRRMAESILSDLARVVAESVIAQAGLNQVGLTIGRGMAPGASAPRDSNVGSAGAIANAVAMAAVKGARFI